MEYALKKKQHIHNIFNWQKLFSFLKRTKNKKILMNSKQNPPAVTKNTHTHKKKQKPIDSGVPWCRRSARCRDWAPGALGALKQPPAEKNKEKTPKRLYMAMGQNRIFSGSQSFVPVSFYFLNKNGFLGVPYFDPQPYGWTCLLGGFWKDGLPGWWNRQFWTGCLLGGSTQMRWAIPWMMGSLGRPLGPPQKLRQS